MYYPGVTWWRYTHQHKYQNMKFHARTHFLNKISKIVSNSAHAD